MDDIQQDKDSSGWKSRLIQLLQSRTFWISLGVVVGVALFVSIGVLEDKRDSATSVSDEFRVWRWLLSVQPVVWGILFALTLENLISLKRYLREKTDLSQSIKWVLFAILAYGSLLAALLVGVFAGVSAGARLDLPHGQWLTIPATVIAAAAMIPSVITLRVIQQTARNKHASTPDAAGIRLIGQLRLQARPAEAALGTILALGVLSNGMIRLVVVADGDPFPRSAVILYGVLITGIVAAVYIHVFTALEDRSRQIVNEIAALITPDVHKPDAFTKRMELREELSGALGLGRNTHEGLASVAMVFAPLAAALLTTVLEAS